jgi:hypothetical protein
MMSSFRTCPSRVIQQRQSRNEDMFILSDEKAGVRKKLTLAPTGESRVTLSVGRLF